MTTSFEELVRQASTAPEDRRAAALQVLNGESAVRDEILTTKQLADRLQISTVSIWRLTRKGMPSFQIGGLRRYCWRRSINWLINRGYDNHHDAR